MDNLSSKLFGDDFAWGVSAAAFQTEGAVEADGKGRSIWDTFTSKKGNVLNGDNAQIACDFYHRYKEDIDIIKSLGIPNFRFSLSWSRIIPDGTGNVNNAGIAFYNKVINYALKQGVEPWVTLYHWDLPQALENKGGWTNREIIIWFSEYTRVCAKAFGDRVKYWMVMNEPAVFTGAGYFLGIHAPGKSGLRNFIPAVHHTVMAMGAGLKVLRDLTPKAQVGTTFSCSQVEAVSKKPNDIAAAARANALINRLFIEPVLGLGYPLQEVTALRKIEKYILPGDREKMACQFDFIGLQNYTREVVAHSFWTPYIGAKLIKAAQRKVPLTEMGWEVYPPAIYEVIKNFSAYKNIPPIIITENGAAFKDELTDGAVNDTRRTAFLKAYLQQVLKAMQEGCNVRGYFIWTLTDNFEWAEGYKPRFGIVHIDFKTLKRTIKASGYWFRDMIKG